MQPDTNSRLLSKTTLIYPIPFDVSKYVQQCLKEGAVSYAEKMDINSQLNIYETKDLLTYREFCSSKEHMDMPTFTDRQLKIGEELLGTDPFGIFDHLKELAVIMVGKGSGKDTIAVTMLCYVVYILLNIKSPQKFFKIMDTDYIDCVNTAPSAQNAATVFFDKLRQKLLKWKWLNDRYPIKASGVFTTQFKPEPGQSYVTITRDGVIFPKGIRLLSRNSSSESSEGLNTLFYILDEASAFSDMSNKRNADKLFKALRSSSKTRFGNRGKGCIISFPREQNDFTVRMYERYKNNPNAYVDKGATWEFKPSYFFSGKTFEFEGRQIPIEFKDDFELDPNDAKSKYLAEPPAVIHGFIEYPEKIKDIIDYDRRPLLTVEDYIQDSKVCKRLLNFNSSIPDVEYIITIDLGEIADVAAFSIFHSEYSHKVNNTVFVQDFVTGWVPNRSEKLQVSFTNIYEFIRTLNYRMRISAVWFDAWQSVTLIESLKAAGIPAYKYYLKYEDYKVMKELIYAKRFSLLNFEPQITEFTELVEIKHRVDHPDNGSKDFVDTICGAQTVFLKYFNNSQDPLATNFWNETEIIEENLDKNVDPWR